MTDLSDTAHPSPVGAPPHRAGWLNRLAASPRVQARLAGIPVLRRLVRAEGRAIFDLVAGFVHSQALMALVELDVPGLLSSGPMTPTAVAARTGLDPDRALILLRAGAAMGLLSRRRDGRFRLTARGAALSGVPGLAGMILHHRVLYGDLADPVAFLRGQTDPALARFWPYVFGAGAAADPAAAARYSRLMTETQGMVAEETLRLADLSGIRRMIDVGGGTGAFVAAAARRYPGLSLTLFDLPAVVAGAPALLVERGLSGRVDICPGSFRDDPLPGGHDAISLVRVLYDHSDDTVRALLAKVRAALPPGGRVIVSEPMSGGDRADPITDTYFAFYTLAMGTGRTRSAAEIAALLAGAGFGRVEVRKGFRPFVTSVVTAARV
jgi:demethylspheroidene O-methyltransferase